MRRPERFEDPYGGGGGGRLWRGKRDGPNVEWDDGEKYWHDEGGLVIMSEGIGQPRRNFRGSGSPLAHGAQKE